MTGNVKVTTSSSLMYFSGSLVKIKVLDRYLSYDQTIINDKEFIFKMYTQKVSPKVALLMK